MKEEIIELLEQLNEDQLDLVLKIIRKLVKQ